MKALARPIVLHGGTLQTIRKGVAACCLLLYVAAVLGVDAVQGFIHHHAESTVHSAALERDACHRAVVHGDTQRGCHHRAHLSQRSEGKAYDVVLQTLWLCWDDEALVVTSHEKPRYTGLQNTFSIDLRLQLQLRGPPMC